MNTSTFAIRLEDGSPIFEGNLRSIAEKIVEFEISRMLQSVGATEMLSPLGSHEDTIQEIHHVLQIQIQNLIKSGVTDFCIKIPLLEDEGEAAS